MSFANHSSSLLGEPFKIQREKIEYKNNIKQNKKRKRLKYKNDGGWEKMGHRRAGCQMVVGIK